MERAPTNPTPPPSWAELRAFVRQSRQISASNDQASVAHNFTFSCPSTSPDGGVTVYALGKAIAGQREHTLVYVDLPPPTDETLGENSPTNVVVSWSGLVLQKEDMVLNSRLSKQEELLQERKRHRCYGITAYDFHSPTRSILFTAGGQLFTFVDNKERRSTASLTPLKLSDDVSSPLNVTFCPDDARLIALVAANDIYLLFDGVCQRATFANDLPSKSFAGVPAYVYQEEFDRFEGYWWRPTPRRRGGVESKIVREKQSNGKHYLLFEETDESEVNEISICVPASATDSVEVMRYPAAGTKNATSTLKLLEITVKNETEKRLNIVEKVLKIPLSDLFPWAEYIVRIGWHPNGEAIWAQLLSRDQTHIAVVLVSLSFFVSLDRMHMQTIDLSHPPVVVLYEETNDLFVQCHDHFKFLPPVDEVPFAEQSQLQFIWLSEMSGFAHLYRITSDIRALQSKSTVQLDRCVERSAVGYAHVREVLPLTQGPWAVQRNTPSQIVEERGFLYFVGTADSPIEQHAYITSYTGSDRICRRLTSLGASHCADSGGGHHAWLSSCGRYLLDVCSSFREPSQCFVHRIESGCENSLPCFVPPIRNIVSAPKRPLLLVEMDDEEASMEDGQEASMEEEGLDEGCEAVPVNEETSHATILIGLSAAPSLRTCVEPRIFTYTGQTSNITHNGLLFVPENAQPGVKLPTVLYVYGGPNIQLVRNTYYGNRLGFQDFLHFGFCVVMLDGRGSSGRGLQFEGALKHKMGTVEVDDQVEGLLYCANNETDHIDLSRVGVFGWSYGGYMALMMICQWPSLFKCSIAGAPVTSWHLYDTGYTERYMGLPQMNEKEYALSSILTKAILFPDEPNRLLILHGLNDENVHFSHTAQLISALVRAGKPYSLQIYPNERHAARRGDSSEHMDTTVLQFILQNL